MEKSNSFLKQILGVDTYEGFRYFNNNLFLIYVAVLFVTYVLSFFVYWSIVSKILQLLTGTSLLSVLFLCCLILKLDIPFTQKEEYTEVDVCYNKKHYRLTKVWAVFLCLFGILSIYFSERYSDNYDFKSSIVFVDEQSNTYHLFENCEDISDISVLKEMKGHEALELGYELCPECEYLLEEYEDICRCGIK